MAHNWGVQAGACYAISTNNDINLIIIIIIRNIIISISSSSSSSSLIVIVISSLISTLISRRSAWTSWTRSSAAWWSRASAALGAKDKDCNRKPISDTDDAANNNSSADTDSRNMSINTIWFRANNYTRNHKSETPSGNATESPLEHPVEIHWENDNPSENAAEM